MTATLHQTEAQFQRALIDFARLVGWKCAHFRGVKVDTANGPRHMTPVAADARGFPDLVLVRERVVFAELKSQRGRLRDDQLVWIDDLIDAGVEAYCWKPSDWPAIERILTCRAPAHG